MDKQFWIEALKVNGFGTLLALMLIMYNIGENKKWEQNQAASDKRWEQLFLKYSDDQQRSIETIRACCMEQRTWSPK